MSDDQKAIKEITSAIPEFKLELVLNDQSYASFKKLLAQKVNELINDDFLKLVSILYRLDISEMKLKEQLQKNKEEAGDIIAEMIFQRQMEKMAARASFEKRKDIAEDEKW